MRRSYTTIGGHFLTSQQLLAIQALRKHLPRTRMKAVTPSKELLQLLMAHHLLKHHPPGRAERMDKQNPRGVNGEKFKLLLTYGVMRGERHTQPIPRQRLLMRLLLCDSHGLAIHPSMFVPGPADWPPI